MKFISLFSGVGGFDLALTRLGHECVYANDIDKYCKIIYDKHFKTKLDLRDIRTINAEELPDCDLLCGGFPCQSFSSAGKRGGFEDTRGTLFFEIARITKAKRPKILFLENVKGLLSHDGGRTFATIILALDELGYDLQWSVEISKDFGVPQNRERVFIIGHLRGEPRPEVFPIRQVKEVCSRKEKAQTANTITSNYWKGVGSARPFVLEKKGLRKLTPLECERLQGFPDGWTEVVSDTQRYKMMGNAVTVNVIYEIAKHL